MLSKSKEGRNVFKHIGGDVYEISPEDWRSNLKRKDRYEIYLIYIKFI
jgi:hypothetical protein